MFGWFAPRCPVDPVTKDWIEQKLAWLSDEFGSEVFTRRAIILPTVDFFPEVLDGTELSVRRLLDRVCRYMDVDRRQVVLKLFTQKSHLGLVNESGKPLPSGAAGLYEEGYGKTTIHIETTELLDIAGLVSTMAHELSHLRLMGERRVTGFEYDNELLTDLTAAFHGFGIFMGNSPRNWDGMYSTWPDTDRPRPEYMTPPMHSYVLAHAAWHRGERKPEWLSFLNFGLRSDVKQGIRFLHDTSDSTFAPGKPR